MNSEREVAVLLPYKIENESVVVFLQKRGKEARILPDHFSFFGGKIEPGEQPEQALVREIKEELNFNVQDYHFLGTYHSFFNKSIILHVYFTEVDENFEQEIQVNEGEYGKFFSKQEILEEPKLIESDKKIIKDLYIKYGSH